MVELTIAEDTTTVRAHAPRVPVDLVCGVCGYGVAAPNVPQCCPMCHEAAWEPAAWRPFAARLELLDGTAFES